MRTNFVSRREFLAELCEECMRELYRRAQPMADWDNLVAEYQAGKIGKDERVYERHYVSQEEFEYVLQKYAEVFKLKEQWRPYIEVLEEYLNKGGSKDKYYPDRKDKDGFVHPGYRGYKEVPPLKEHIRKIMKAYDNSPEAEKVADKICKKVMSLIKDCKDFYKFDREESQFGATIALGASPTSNKETVIKWWKDNYNQDITIEDRIPRLFWYYDQGYTDEDLAEEFESYGENWKEKLYEEWQEEKRKKKEEHNKMCARLEKKWAKKSKKNEDNN